MNFERPNPGDPILISVGERMMEIRFPLGVLKELEQKHAISPLKGFSTSIVEPVQLAVVLYFGLKTKQPDITQEWVDQNIDASMLTSIYPYLLYAMSGRWPQDFIDKIEDADRPRITAELPNPTPPQETSNGSPSGRSLVLTSGSPSETSGG